MEYLTVEILGENESLSEVRHDLNLTNRLEPYGLSVQWESRAPETVSDMGLLSLDIPNGVQVTLRQGSLMGSSIVVRDPVTVFLGKRHRGRHFGHSWSSLGNRRGEEYSRFRKALRGRHFTTGRRPVMGTEV